MLDGISARFVEGVTRRNISFDFSVAVIAHPDLGNAGLNPGRRKSAGIDPGSGDRGDDVVRAIPKPVQHGCGSGGGRRFPEGLAVQSNDRVSAESNIPRELTGGELRFFPG